MKTKISLVAGFLSSFCLVSENIFADNLTHENVPAVSERYSDKVIFRPGVMPVDIINFETELSISSSKKEGQNLERTTNLSIKGQFGIVKNLQGEISYFGAFPFTPTDDHKASNKLTLATRYNYLSIPHISFGASAKLPMHVRSGGEIVRDVTFGLPVTFYNDLMAGSIFYDIFTLTMRPNVEFETNFNAWYGVQVFGNLWAMVDTSFGSIKLENPNNQAKWTSTPFWKKLPAGLALTYVINHYIDLGATFGFDDTLKAKDTMKFGVNFSVRGGKIFG